MVLNFDCIIQTYFIMSDYCMFVVVYMTYSETTCTVLTQNIYALSCRSESRSTMIRGWPKPALRKALMHPQTKEEAIGKRKKESCELDEDYRDESIVKTSDSEKDKEKKEINSDADE